MMTNVINSPKQHVDNTDLLVRYEIKTPQPIYNMCIERVCQFSHALNRGFGPKWEMGVEENER